MRQWLPDFYDVLVMAGIGLLWYGLYLVSLPLSMGVLGAILFLMGLAGAWLKGGREK